MQRLLLAVDQAVEATAEQAFVAVMTAIRALHPEATCYRVATRTRPITTWIDFPSELLVADLGSGIVAVDPRYFQRRPTGVMNDVPAVPGDPLCGRTVSLTDLLLAVPNGASINELDELVRRYIEAVTCRDYTLDTMEVIQ